MNEKHGHHTVPRALIENFSLDGKRVFKYRFNETKIIPTTPKDAFRRRHYHSVVKDDGSTDHNLVEDEFEKLEGPGIAAIRNYVSTQLLNSDDRQWISLFIALQHLRTPIARAITEKALLETLKATTMVMDKRGMFSELPDALKAYGSNVTELIEKQVLQHVITLPQVTMRGMIAIQSTAPIIAEMNFCLIEANGSDYFLLADNPVSIFDPDYEKHGYGLGLAYPRIEIVLPVGARHCILATPKPCPERLSANKKRVQEINKRSAIFADEEAVFPMRSKTIMGFLRTYGADRPGAATQSIKANDGVYAIAKRTAYSTERGRRAYQSCKPLIAVV